MYITDKTISTIRSKKYFVKNKNIDSLRLHFLANSVNCNMLNNSSKMTKKCETVDSTDVKASAERVKAHTVLRFTHLYKPLNSQTTHYNMSTEYLF